MDNTSRAATDAAYQAADQLFRGTQTSLEWVVEILRRRGAVNIPDEITAWDRSGGTFTSFSADRSVLSDMQSLLVENEIPFVNSVDENGAPFIVIRDCDTAKADSLKKDVLIRQSGYYMQVSLNDLHTAAANSPSNRRVAGFSGLSQEEAELLSQKANRFGRGVTVAKEKMSDGTYYVAVASRSFMGDSPYRTDLAQAYVETVLALHGPNRVKNREDLEKQLTFEEDLEKHLESFYREEPGDEPSPEKESWVIGRNDDSQYVRFTKGGAEFGLVSKSPEGGRLLFNGQDTVRRDAPDFEERVHSFCAKIRDKEILSIKGDVYKHFQYHGNRTHGYSDWTPAERRIDTGERKLVRVLNEKIKDNMRSEGLIRDHGNEQQKMAVYVMSIKEAFEGIRQGVRPQRFSEEQWTEITTVASANGMNLAQYIDAEERLDFYELNGYEVDSRFFEMDLPAEDAIRSAKARDADRPGRAERTGADSKDDISGRA